MKVSEVTEAIKRPELNVVHSRKELEAAYQQMISICDAQETTIEMLKERGGDIQDALNGTGDWHVAIKLIKEIMDANDIIIGDLE